jgi:site-specific DNA-methyltransferase (adenine-specific)
VNTIYNDDCLGERGLCTLADQSIDMILCDLPYGTTRNPWDSILPLDKLFTEYRRITKPNAAIVLFGQGMFTCQLVQAGPDIWRYNLVWDKVMPSGHLNARRMPLRSHEDILVFYSRLPVHNPQMTRGKPNHSIGKNPSRTVNNYGEHERVDNRAELGEMKYPRSILSFEKPHPPRAIHPTEKPAALCEYLIRTYTHEGALVLDNCMGSGTTADACRNCNRRYVGWELDQNYYAACITRLNSAQPSVSQVTASPTEDNGSFERASKPQGDAALPVGREESSASDRPDIGNYMDA